MLSRNVAYFSALPSLFRVSKGDLWACPRQIRIVSFGFSFVWENAVARFVDDPLFCPSRGVSTMATRDFGDFVEHSWCCFFFGPCQLWPVCVGNGDAVGGGVCEGVGGRV